MPSFHLQIISPDRIEFDGEVESLVAPVDVGYIGVLANHAPLLSILGEGRVTARNRDGDSSQYLVSGGGFLEVCDNRVVVLAQQVVTS